MADDGMLYGTGPAGFSGQEIMFRVNRDGSNYVILTKSLEGNLDNPLVWGDGAYYLTSNKGVIRLSPTDGKINVIDPLTRRVFGYDNHMLLAQGVGGDDINLYRYNLPNEHMPVIPVVNFKSVAPTSPLGIQPQADAPISSPSNVRNR